LHNAVHPTVLSSMSIVQGYEDSINVLIGGTVLVSVV